ncbi:DinB family protein [uncultured Psychroserpens sp.]|uniref:DinB family protein n=1 Tax=uncultured Psychroserpens sp. TaxID=255436 RepID=UPI002634BE40|nr:DinB family protein [uncultured Psychroserpens sp.]
MKKLVSIIALTVITNFTVLGQSSSIADDMATLLTSMKTYTLALAEQMPADKFEYKPSESDELRTFAEHYKHIKNFMGFQLLLLKNEKFDFSSLIANNKTYESTVVSKEKVISDLSNKFDEVIAFYKNTTDKSLSETYPFVWESNKPNRSRLLITMALRDHMSHHRAQSIVYLRENGIKPVQYQRY